ncbi:MAG: C-terminal helicase domain-containing protein, partial [Muribaculaceae bacterium]|nr:C-terminal helicase domain-containing protein [Muribaculaceae bacterium]
LDWDTPIEWVDTADLEMREEMVSDTNGRINKEEADLLLERLLAYVDKIGLERIIEERIDFGIISPYKAQVHYLRHRLKKTSALQPLRKMISVNTVDGFQGQERDVIFISMVRANEQGNIGFLNDLRRMNVAITRARMKLVILGDANTLTRHPFYHRLHAYILSLRQQ